MRSSQKKSHIEYAFKKVSLNLQRKDKVLYYNYKYLTIKMN